MLPAWTLGFLLGKLKSPSHVLEKRSGDEPHGEVLLHTKEQASGHLNPVEMPSSLEDMHNRFVRHKY